MVQLIWSGVDHEEIQVGPRVTFIRHPGLY